MKNHLILGDWNAICDCCGFKFKASTMRKRWDGLMVCPQDWESRHPQDFLRVGPDNTPIPWSRPDSSSTSTPPVSICTINGTSAIVGYSVVDCMIVDNMPPGFDPNAPFICVPVLIFIDAEIPVDEFLWVCSSLSLQATLQINGIIGIY